MKDAVRLERYKKMQSEIGHALQFMEACGMQQDPSLSHVEVGCFSKGRHVATLLNMELMVLAFHSTCSFSLPMKALFLTLRRQ